MKRVMVLGKIVLALSVCLTVALTCGRAERGVEEPSDTPPPPTIPVTVGPAGYSDVSIPLGEFPDHPHIDVVMHSVVGGQLTVTLGSDPTTGFQWSEDADISDQTIVRQTGHGFVDGADHWTFKGLKRGTTTIFMEHSRPEVLFWWLYWTVTIAVTID